MSPDRFALGPDALWLQAALDRDGYAILPKLLDEGACESIARMYDVEGTGFRSTVVMARHGYGRGEYRYFSRPLPGIVQSLRETLYPPLAQVASAWSQRSGKPRDWPLEHATLLDLCALAGQLRPTPLLLRYGPAITTDCMRTSTAAYFTPCRSGISPHAGPTFHVMPVQDFTACRSKISRHVGQDFTESQAGSS